LTDVIAGDARQAGTGLLARTRVIGRGSGDGHTSEGEPEPASPVRLHHEPALDGLRGLAVAAVVVFHIDRIDGGFLGVDLFFVLSGFLITSLLLAEHGRQGALDLVRFWGRRARRLLPALFVVVAVIGLLLLWLTPEAQRAGFRGDALSTLGYVANWHKMFESTSYWDMFSQPSPFDHMWSLAIEEQFYVVWPLVVLLILGRLRPAASSTSSGSTAGVRPRGDRLEARQRVLTLGLLSLVGAITSMVLLWVMYDPGHTNRAYFGTDTRLGPTLLGATLATVVAGRPRRDNPPPLLAELIALGALGWMAISMVAIDGVGPSYYNGGLAAFALCSVAVIAIVTGGPVGRVGGVLSCSPLRSLGNISYGVYLWHWPVIVYLTADRAHLGGVPLDVLRVLVTLAAALLSYQFVEMPIRQGALKGTKLRRVALAGVGVAVAMALVSTAGEPAATYIARPEGSLLGADNEYLHVPAEDDFPAGTTKVLLVGDSGPMHLGPTLVEAGEDGDSRGAEVAVGFSSQILCSPVYAAPRGRLPDGTVDEREECPQDRLALWGDLIDEWDPDVVVYYLANAGGWEHEDVGGQWVWDCDPAYDLYLHDALSDDVALLGSGGARVALSTSPYTAIPEATTGQRVDCRNATYRSVAADHPGTAVIDMNRFVADTIATSDVPMFSDPVHLSDQGSELVSDWLLDQVALLDQPAPDQPHPKG
jgi:peptidoglycan/LPS O-acetylase OafA/YrhL